MRSVLVFLVPLALSLSASAAGTITYVQGNSAVPQTPQTTVTVPYTGAQTAGDLNVVVVGWNDSIRTVASVTDSKGNTYAAAVGPTVLTGSLSQTIYYAKNIVGATAGSNSVTVTFSGAAAFPDIRILEYVGADLVNPVDVTAAGSGFTQRLLTVPDGDIAEDRMVTAVGSYSAVAPITSGGWIMQMVASR